MLSVALPSTFDSCGAAILLPCPQGTRGQWATIVFDLKRWKEQLVNGGSPRVSCLH